MCLLFSRSIAESVKVGNRRVVYREGGGSVGGNSKGAQSNGQATVTALQLQQEDFEQLRQEHSVSVGGK